MKLSAEQIQNNWNQFLSYIDIYISEPRASKLKSFYEKYADRIILMPASHKKEYHNAFPGGYVEHVNRVIEAALKINSVWVELGVEQNYTLEELIFSAMNHDLGKMGSEEHEAYLPQTDEWRKNKLGEDYLFNTELEFMSVPDRGLYLLQTHGVEYTKNEYLSIKLHDGIYDEANKPYLMGWLPGQKLRCALPLIIHQADFLAARVEFEREWFPKFKNNLAASEKSSTLDAKQPVKKSSIKTKALNNIQSPNLKTAIDEFFNKD
jgi:hypothetical protein